MTTRVITSLTDVTVLIGLIALIWGIVSYKRQMNAQLFLEFTKRFEEVMQTFPRNAWAGRLNMEGELPASSDELSLGVLRYLNLCSEEYYLYKNHWLDKRIWKIWEAELVRTLRTPLFVREWKQLENEFESYPGFVEFIRKSQKS